MTALMRTIILVMAVVMAVAVTPTECMAADDNFQGKFEHATSDSSNISIFVGGLYYGLGATHSHGLTGLTQEVGMLDVVGVACNFGNANRLSLGVGYQYKWFDLKRDYQFASDIAGGTFITTWPEGTRQASSELRLHTVQFPLVYGKGFATKWHFFVGAILDWNVYASYRNGHKEDNTSIAEVTNKLHQNKCTVDFICAFQWKAAGLYARYSPCKVFKDDCGPLMDNTWSVGFALGF